MLSASIDCQQERLPVSSNICPTVPRYRRSTSHGPRFAIQGHQKRPLNRHHFTDLPRIVYADVQQALALTCAGVVPFYSRPRSLTFHSSLQPLATSCHHTDRTSSLAVTTVLRYQADGCLIILITASSSLLHIPSAEIWPPSTPSASYSYMSGQ